MTMLLDADDSQLVLVDYQLRLMPAIFESQQVIANAVRLARLAAALRMVWLTCCVHQCAKLPLAVTLAACPSICKKMRLPKMKVAAPLSWPDVKRMSA